MWYHMIIIVDLQIVYRGQIMMVSGRGNYLRITGSF